MSRIGRMPIPIPSGVQIEQDAGRRVMVKGPKGSLDLVLRPEVDLEVTEATAVVNTNGSGALRQSR